MARATGPRKVHRYTAEFKLKAVKLSELNGIQVQDVGYDSSVHCEVVETVGQAPGVVG